MALSMLQHIVIDKRIPAAFFSLEMSDVQLMQRLVAQVSRIRADTLRTGFLGSDDFAKLQTAASTIYEAPLYIVDTPNMKLLDLRSVARRLRSKEKIEIIDEIGSKFFCYFFSFKIFYRFCCALIFYNNYLF